MIISKKLYTALSTCIKNQKIETSISLPYYFANDQVIVATDSRQMLIYKLSNLEIEQLKKEGITDNIYLNLIKTPKQHALTKLDYSYIFPGYKLVVNKTWDKIDTNIKILDGKLEVNDSIFYCNIICTIKKAININKIHKVLKNFKSETIEVFLCPNSQELKFELGQIAYIIGSIKE